MTTDYTEVDAAILAATRKTPGADFTVISRMADKPAQKVADSAPVALHSFRVIDRRLQALRKAGRISYSRSGGWVLVES